MWGRSAVRLRDDCRVASPPVAFIRDPLDVQFKHGWLGQLRTSPPGPSAQSGQPDSRLARSLRLVACSYTAYADKPNENDDRDQSVEVTQDGRQ